MKIRSMISAIGPTRYAYPDNLVAKSGNNISRHKPFLYEFLDVWDHI